MDTIEYDIDRPRCIARYAAELELFSPRQGEGNVAKTPLEVEVSLGEQSFVTSDNGGDVGFKIRFRRVILEVSVQNGLISRENRYQRTLAQEEFKQYIKRVIETSRINDGNAEVGVSKALSSLLGAIGIDLSAHAKVMGEIKNGNLSGVEASVPFKLVRWVGAGRWEVGHQDLGDPREIDGLLKGAYFFPPSDGRRQEEYNPVCWVEPAGKSNYSVIVELRAKLVDCAYQPLGDRMCEPLWAARNKNAIEKRVVQKMMQERNRADGLEPPEGEIVLARGGIKIKRKKASDGR